MFLPYSFGALMKTYDAEFEDQIRDLLSDLYDYLKLADNPVAGALTPGLSGNERLSAIRRLVLRAIDEMKSETKVGPISRRNRLYHILQLRYVEQQSTVDVLQSAGAERTAILPRASARDSDHQPRHLGRAFCSVRGAAGIVDAVTTFAGGRVGLSQCRSQSPRIRCRRGDSGGDPSDAGHRPAARHRY